MDKHNRMIAVQYLKARHYPPRSRANGSGAGHEGTPAHRNAINHICAHGFCPPLNLPGQGMAGPRMARFVPLSRFLPGQGMAGPRTPCATT